MDTSEQYIKMCEKAEEIQKHKPEGSQGEFVYCEGVAYLEVDDVPLTPFVWLPRQDQLQEMVKDPDFTDGSFIVADLHYKIHGFFNDRYSDYPNLFTSMEQLWFAFVMKEKFGKVWSEDEWK